MPTVNAEGHRGPSVASASPLCRLKDALKQNTLGLVAKKGVKAVFFQSYAGQGAAFRNLRFLSAALKLGLLFANQYAVPVITSRNAEDRHRSSGLTAEGQMDPKQLR